MTRKALGRGLSALLPDTPTHISDDLRELDVDGIVPNEQQPRTTFHEETLDELAQSIKENGIVQPIVVRRKGNGYELIAGERRWRAAQRAGLVRIPAVIRDVPDGKLLELALIENIQREELNPIEEAVAYKKLIEELGLRHEDLAQRIGKERTTVSNMLRLLRLPEDIQALIAEGQLSTGHARALVSLEDADLQRRIAELVVAKGLSVRETEQQVKRLIAGETPPIPKEPTPRDPNVKAAELKLQSTLGTKVRINHKAKGGRIEIEYYTAEDLDRLYSLLMGLRDRDDFSRSA